MDCSWTAKCTWTAHGLLLKYTRSVCASTAARATSGDADETTADLHSGEELESRHLSRHRRLGRHGVPVAGLREGERDCSRLREGGRRSDGSRSIAIPWIGATAPLFCRGARGGAPRRRVRAGASWQGQVGAAAFSCRRRRSGGGDERGRRRRGDAPFAACRKSAGKCLYQMHCVRLVPNAFRPPSAF